MHHPIASNVGAGWKIEIGLNGIVRSEEVGMEK